MAATGGKILQWCCDMKVIKVYGVLRQQVGGICRFEFDVDTPAQALKALLVNFPHLEKWLIDSEKDGIGYRVTIGREYITSDSCDAMGMPFSEREVFSIAPVVVGSGRGALPIIIGIALIATAIVLAPAGSLYGLGAGLGTAGAGLTSAATATSIALVGVSLVTRGIAQIISPAAMQSIDRERARLESYGFSGITNTAVQGGPVPVAYGLPFVGSQVISTGLDTDNI